MAAADVAHAKLVDATTYKYTTQSGETETTETGETKMSEAPPMEIVPGINVSLHGGGRYMVTLKR